MQNVVAALISAESCGNKSIRNRLTHDKEMEAYQQRMQEVKDAEAKRKREATCDGKLVRRYYHLGVMRTTPPPRDYLDTVLPGGDEDNHEHTMLGSDEGHSLAATAAQQQSSVTADPQRSPRKHTTRCAAEPSVSYRPHSSFDSHVDYLTRRHLQSGMGGPPPTMKYVGEIERNNHFVQPEGASDFTPHMARSRPSYSFQPSNNPAPEYHHMRGLLQYQSAMLAVDPEADRDRALTANLLAKEYDSLQQERDEHAMALILGGGEGGNHNDDEIQNVEKGDDRAKLRSEALPPKQKAKRGASVYGAADESRTGRTRPATSGRQTTRTTSSMRPTWSAARRDITSAASVSRTKKKHQVHGHTFGLEKSVSASSFSTAATEMSHLTNTTEQTEVSTVHPAEEANNGTKGVKSPDPRRFRSTSRPATGGPSSVSVSRKDRSVPPRPHTSSGGSVVTRQELLQSRLAIVGQRSAPVPHATNNSPQQVLANDDDDANLSSFLTTGGGVLIENPALRASAQQLNPPPRPRTATEVVRCGSASYATRKMRNQRQAAKSAERLFNGFRDCDHPNQVFVCL